MPGFICDFLNEIVLLSDGRVTTCCMDPLGANVMADIAQADFSDIRRTYLKIREQITQNVLSMPRCAVCYSKIKAAGFPQTGTYRVEPDQKTVAAFLDNGEQSVRQFVIELSSLCNLKCNGCMQSRYDFNAYRTKPYMDTEFLQSWLEANLKNI